MLLRRLILRKKTGQGPPGPWNDPPIRPRLSPFPRGLRLPSGWRWRALPCRSGDDEFLLLGQVNVSRGNYKAWLLHRDTGDWRLLARIEDHASHPGLHAHVHCGEVLPDPGAGSVGAAVRRPSQRPYRRTAQGCAPDVFWVLACAILRIGLSPTNPDQGIMDL